MSPFRTSVQGVSETSVSRESVRGFPVSRFSFQGVPEKLFCLFLSAEGVSEALLGARQLLSSCFREPLRVFLPRRFPASFLLSSLQARPVGFPVFLGPARPAQGVSGAFWAGSENLGPGFGKGASVSPGQGPDIGFPAFSRTLTSRGHF